MKKGIFLAFILLLGIFTISYAQQIKPELKAVRIENPPKIDGKLDDDVWKTIPIGKNFTQNLPLNGGQVSSETEIQFAYDDRAIYFAAKMYDKRSDVVKGMNRRDAPSSELNTDLLILALYPFNDGINGYEFGVSPAGVQLDRKMSDQGSHIIWNTNWDAVWKSEVHIDDDYWTIEFEIPFSELRFLDIEEQEWGFNVWRQIRRLKEWNAFAYVDNEIDGTIKQGAILTGLNNIEPPLRLSFTPYFTSKFIKYRSEDGYKFKLSGGLDVKYGINESFTLDMMLIPDFSEVEPDDQILNLSQFETQFEEKRPFFTEGTELFNRGNVFYSKRIGENPRGFNKINQRFNEGTYTEVLENPAEAKLINATKISGRTNKGLGIGVFNAIAGATYAKVKNQRNEIEEVNTEGLTNYSMIVLEQTLKNNSYVSIFNTNVWSKDSEYMANVTGADFRLANNKNTYAINGKAIVSQKYYKDTDNEIGHSYFWRFSKIHGNFRFGIEQNVMSDSYDPNDMGYIAHNNLFSFKGDISFNFYKPRGIFNSWYNKLSLEHTYLYNPRTHNGILIQLNSDMTLKNFWNLGLLISKSADGWNDYYHTGLEGVNFRWSPWTGVRFSVATNNSKKVSLKVVMAYEKNSREYADYNQKRHYISITPTIRFSNRFFMSHEFAYDLDSYFKVVNNSDPEHIYFGQGDITNFVNTLTANYVFTRDMTVSFRLRHYWRRAEYDSFYELQDDGYVLPSTYTGNHDVNYNSFNINLIYSWRFAPGSELSLIWKYAVDEREDYIRTHSFTRNFGNLFDMPSQNSLSLKLLYYIDWQKLKGRS
ncbi:MAG: hypothetical protein CL663_08860 [Bacteroidetes bacterium]|nr:hypothetical protein [Bacteroidota bacterium]